jgi:Flp pilus assembly protein TadD
MKILVFEKWLSDPVANVNSIVILDWRSIGEHPMLQICASSKPVGGESDMTMIIPDQPMNQGLYTVEIGSRAHDYQFGVQTPDIASYWEEVLKERPTSWQAHNHFGAIMYMQGNTEAAYRHFIEAVHLNNTNPEIHVNLGLALDRMGKANAAIEQFGTAVQLANDSAIYTDLGNVYLEVKRYSDAVKAYQHAIQLNADIAPAYCNLGYALMQQGKVDDAILEFRKAVEIDPNLSQAQTNLNEALHRKTTNLDQK